jgi:hypothetical protein
MQTTIFNKLNSAWKPLATYSLVFILGASSINYNPGGVSTRIQEPLIGATWVKEEGFYFTIPLLSRTRSFNQKGTVASSDNKSIIDTASLTSVPRNLQFADSYEMQIEWSLRYEIPIDDPSLEGMYQSIKTEDNLLGNTLMPFSQMLVNDSVNQMLGGNFAQGGRNALRTLIDNQSQFGMYQTKVEKVSTSRTNGVGSNDTLGGTNADLMITKVVYLTDNTNKRLRTPLSISQYGVKIVPNSINIIEAVPQGRLIGYIDTKQRNIALQIEQDENQKLLVKQAKTEQLTGEKELITKTNSLNIAKESAVIAAEQRVLEAKLAAEKEVVERQKVADLAIIDKTRQLQESKANEGIQKANAVAAKYEADAIKEVGFAEAAVTSAKYKAIDPTILAMEVDKAKALALYESNMVVNMPTVVSGSSGSSNSLETMTTLKVMEQLGRSAVK